MPAEVIFALNENQVVYTGRHIWTSGYGPHVHTGTAAST